MKGLFSVRGMMEYIEDKFKEPFKRAEKETQYSRMNLYIYLAKNNAGLTNLDPLKFASLMTKAYKNYSDEIHDGKRSAKEVSEAGDSIVIRESLLVDYQQIQCIKSFAEYFKYPYEVKLMSRK